MEKVLGGAAPGCEICNKEALFQCSECQRAFYCSRDHQFEHWRKGHKNSCQPARPQGDDLQKKIFEVRKSYYENFSHKQFSECLLDAKVLVGLERKRLQVAPSPDYELDYGGTVCLLTKTYLLLNDKKSGKQELEQYLKEKGPMLQDLTEVPSLKQKETVKEKYYQQLQKRLNLISCIANLSYAIGMDCISYYVLYTKIIMTFFGPGSYEASNCYFLVGCYFAEEGYFRKAIECFKKSADIRGNFAGDCLYNIGVLYKLQGELPKALEILQKALKLREEQYGEDSSKVAEINEMMGIIYTELNDFKTAMMEYDKAFKLRASEPKSAEFFNVLELIHQLYDKLSVFIEQGQPKVKKPDIYTNLKAAIQSQKMYWEEPKYKKKINDATDDRDPKKQEPAAKKDDKAAPAPADPKPSAGVNRFEYSLVLTEEFTAGLNLSQLYRLSELQLQLQKCTTQFGVIYTIGTSPFYEGLTPQRYAELEKHNQRLFQLIKLEDLKKIKSAEM